MISWDRYPDAEPSLSECIVKGRRPGLEPGGWDLGIPHSDHIKMHYLPDCKRRGKLLKKEVRILGTGNAFLYGVVSLVVKPRVVIPLSRVRSPYFSPQIFNKRAST